MSSPRRPVVVTIALIAVLAACTSDDDHAAGPTDVSVVSATTASNATTSSTAAPTTATTTASSATATATPVSDAEPGLRWDIGILVDVVDGAMIFDRVQTTLDDGSLASAPNLPEEQIMGGYTDSGFVNSNLRLRTYPMAPDLESLLIDPEWTSRRPFCSDDEASWTIDEPIVYLDVEVEALVALKYVSLTFDEDGRVSRIRDVSGC